MRTAIFLTIFASAVIAFCSSCATLYKAMGYGDRIPGFDGAHVVGDPSPYTPTPEDTAAFMLLWENRAHEVLPAIPQGRLHTYLSRVHITYTTAKIGEPSTPDMVITGVTNLRNLVVVLVDSKRSNLANNALAHELLHSILWNEYGNPEVLHDNRWSSGMNYWEASVRAQWATKHP